MKAIGSWLWWCERPRLCVDCTHADRREAQRNQGEGAPSSSVAGNRGFLFFFLFMDAGFGVVGRNSTERCAFIYGDAPLRVVWVWRVTCGRVWRTRFVGRSLEGEGDMWGCMACGVGMSVMVSFRGRLGPGGVVTCEASGRRPWAAGGEMGLAAVQWTAQMRPGRWI